MEFFKNKIAFFKAESIKQRDNIFPIFLPFLGCPGRCVFCDQNVQTGQKPASIHTILENAAKSLIGLSSSSSLKANRNKFDNVQELAFFGGTFTSLAEKDFELCLNFAREWIERGLFKSARCSTRPDSISPSRLFAMQDAGFTCIELGIQSFQDSALSASQRGYSNYVATAACNMVQAYGFQLCIQLMPGLPGLSAEGALADIEECIKIKPSFVRLYPCLIFKGTALAKLWEENKYSPWDLAPTLAFLAEALERFHSAEIPVARIGVLEDIDAIEAIVAGPRHQSIGDIAIGLALFLRIRQMVSEFVPDVVNFTPMELAEHLLAEDESSELLFSEPSQKLRLYVPKSRQGTFWGYKGRLATAYFALGFLRQEIKWWDEKSFGLELLDRT